MIRTLSKYNPIIKIIPNLFLLVIVVFLLLILSWNVSSLRVYFLYICIVSLFAFLLGIYKIRSFYLEAYCIFFNSDSLILENRTSEKKGYNSNLIIRYSDISNVIQTSTRSSFFGFSFNNYDVFFDKEGREKDVQNFYVSAFSEEMEHFKALARKANPTINIT